jgi:hypothetical protein
VLATLASALVEFDDANGKGRGGPLSLVDEQSPGCWDLSGCCSKDVLGLFSAVASREWCKLSPGPGERCRLEWDELKDMLLMG